MTPLLYGLAPISAERYLVAESPIWDDRRQRAFFVDIKGHLLGAYDPVEASVRHWPVDEDLGFVALTTGEELILGLKSGLCVFHPETGALSKLASVAIAADERLNDGKVAPDGALWFGVMALDAQPGRGRLYRLAPDGSCALVDAGYGVPNGPGFDARGRVLHCDTSAGRILSLVRDGAGWTRQDFASVRDAWGRPDGIEIDALGRVWTGLWGGGGVLMIDARSDPQQSRLPVPATWVTALAPIGCDGDQVLVTSASSPLARGEQSLAPHDGAVFTARLTQSWPAKSRRFTGRLT